MSLILNSKRTKWTVRLHTFKRTVLDFIISGGINMCVYVNVCLACTKEEKNKQIEGLQKMLNALDKCRKVGKLLCARLFYSILHYLGLLVLIKPQTKKKQLC